MTVLSPTSNQSADRLVLVTGPARSGKSEWAETLASQANQSVVYVATAQMDPTDQEWADRIARHRDRRPPTWSTKHIPIELAATIRSANPQDCLLIDSLGTWLANLLEQDEHTWSATETDLLLSLQQTSSRVILVAEETGWGVVPAYPIGRLFRDRLGNLTRKIGAISDAVYLVTAGYVLNLTNLGFPLQKS
jgi:adenosylcobinamide kinase / adenosylcobinamide-phosphate guanylyltransferase